MWTLLCACVQLSLVSLFAASPVRLSGRLVRAGDFQRLTQTSFSLESDGCYIPLQTSHLSPRTTELMRRLVNHHATVVCEKKGAKLSTLERLSVQLTTGIQVDVYADKVTLIVPSVLFTDARGDEEPVLWFPDGRAVQTVRMTGPLVSLSSGFVRKYLTHENMLVKLTGHFTDVRHFGVDRIEVESPAVLVAGKLVTAGSGKFALSYSHSRTVEKEYVEPAQKQDLNALIGQQVVLQTTSVRQSHESLLKIETTLLAPPQCALF